MSEITNRIDNLLVQKNLKRADVCRATGIGDSTIRKWIAGSVPNVEMIYKVAKFLNVTMEYLVAGEGDPQIVENTDSLSFQETKLIEHFRNLNDADKNAVVTLATGLESQYSLSKGKNISIG